VKKLTLFVAAILSLLLAACSSSEAAVVTSGGNADASTAVNRLDENYADALPVQSQLAIGTLQLENTDNAVSEAEAAELLPLWQAVQALNNSDTTADAEMTAVINQIQDTMTPEQVTAIAALQLTADSLQAMLEDGTLTLGRGGGFGNASGSSASSNSGGGFNGRGGMGEGGFAGGPPDGGMPGGGLGGDPAALETRQAATDGSGFADFQSMAMTNAVVRLLQEKTGQQTVPEGYGVFGSAITAVSQATSLSEDEVRAAVSEGQSLAQILEANGGDVAAVTTQLAESLTDSPLLQGQAPQEFVTSLLNGSQTAGGPPTDPPAQP